MTPAQLTLDLDFAQARDELHRDWESAAERESKMLTKYAQSGVKLDEVQAEARAARAAVGSPRRRRPLRPDRAVRARRESIRPRRTVSPSRCSGCAPPRATPSASPLARRPPPGIWSSTPTSRSRPASMRWCAPTRFVRDLARYVLDAALDPEVTGQDNPGPALRRHPHPGRAGTTTLLLARYRFHLTLPGRAETRRSWRRTPSCSPTARRPDGREWVPENEIPALLDARPENVLPELVQRAAARAVDELDQVQDHLDEHGAELAVRLLESHRRVRASVGAHLRGLAVTPQRDHADVLGVYVYLPTDPVRSGGCPVTRLTEQYIGIRLEGGLLANSLLERVAAGSRDLKGSAPADYHLAATERLGDAASRKWLYLRGVYQAFRDRLKRLPETSEATSETREHWLLVLLAELGFGRVPFVRCDRGRRRQAYPVSHLWEHASPCTWSAGRPGSTTVAASTAVPRSR